ncbi:M20/M25/M40 family metallo-hydrolase [Metabacillus herbersteinensis]|uniref:M20/M25/M40 family metallo-hydrolase n=1 Tax=Metabacillus herbersteinensis TaxID=283816 RepID=A0ABV6G840_9BACI
MNKKWQTKEQLTQLLTALVEHASVTGTSGEVALAEYMYYLLKDRDYFTANPDYLNLHPVHDGRTFLSALVKQEGATETIILLSHFDVVNVMDYGDLTHLAFRPHELTKELKTRLDTMPANVAEDLESGEWLFGRGTMDMKAGLAVQFGMLERAMNGEFKGNLLLVTVPDEEANSAGMLSAVPVLNDLKKKWDLNFSACINSEPMFARYPNDPSYYVYTGSIGKILAGFYCSGIESHVGEPFSGLNANLMVSEINRLMELNDSFCEKVGDEMTPPPTNLMQKDLKEEYSVQIPHTAVSLFNLLTMKQSITDVQNQLIKVAELAASQIEDFYQKRSKSYQQYVSFDPLDVKVNVLTYKQLLKKAIEKVGESEVGRRINYLSANRGDEGDRDFSTKLVDDLASLCKEYSPMIVVFYSPPFYPAVSSEHDAIVQDTIQQLIHYADKNYSIPLKSLNYFTGLSDLSFMQLNEKGESLVELTSNMPLYGNHFYLPLNDMQSLNVPVLNVGPVGRDPHKWTERLHLPYTFEVLPDLLDYTITRIFEKASEWSMKEKA